MLVRPKITPGQVKRHSYGGQVLKDGDGIPGERKMKHEGTRGTVTQSEEWTH